MPLCRVLPFLPIVIAGAAQAEAVSLIAGSALGAERGGLFRLASVEDNAAQGVPSLFVGRAATGLFADRPAHQPAFADTAEAGLGGADVLAIRELIGQAESRRDGYDAVQHGARIKPPRRPTEMTVAEIYRWIKDTPGQPHAIGRYQFIPKTLKRVMARIDADPSQRFSPALQDRLADVLLAEAGLHRVRAGKLGRRTFMNNLAKIWAGLPNSTGKSHYEGFAGNKASMTWARFDAEMGRIYPS